MLEPGSVCVPRAAFHIDLPSGRALQLGPRTLVMAIVNVTPDSFSDGGLRADPDRAVDAALELVAAGADILDIGGESTRPGAAPLGTEDEWRRVGPVIERLQGRVAVPISIDTYKAEIARRAVQAGADIVNDISALTYEPQLTTVVAESGAAVILMHNRGRSAAMYEHAEYADVGGEIRDELGERVADAVRGGVARDRILLDPGLGFAKRPEHTVAAVADLGRLASLGLPVVSGPSRKSFLQAAIGERTPDARVWGTAGAVAASVWLGAHVVRVHDVAAMVDVVRVTDLIREAVAGRNV